MKTAKLFLLLICFPSFMISQNIIVGQKQGPGIVYRDIEDIHLHGTEWEHDEVFLDINENGIDDLRFWGYAVYYSHLNYNSSDATVKGLSNTHICVCSDQDTWADNLALNTAINDQMNWGPASVSFVLRTHSSEGTAGVFDGDGYLAFRGYEQDTIYGWMKVFVSCNGFDAYITIYEYAYYDTIITGIQEFEPVDNLVICPNPFASVTTLSYTLDSMENIRFTVYNVQSQIVFDMQEKQTAGEQRIEFYAEGLPAGMYYYQLVAGDRVASGKLVVGNW